MGKYISYGVRFQSWTFLYRRLLPTIYTIYTLTQCNLNLPGWVSSDQSSISLSNFNGDLSYSRLTEIPAQITLPSWVLPSQANVSLSNFSGSLNSGRIEDFPQWLNNTQKNIQLASFGGSLEYSKLTNVPLPASLPIWSSTIL